MTRIGIDNDTIAQCKFVHNEENPKIVEQRLLAKASTIFGNKEDALYWYKNEIIPRFQTSSESAIQKFGSSAHPFITAHFLANKPKESIPPYLIKQMKMMAVSPKLLPTVKHQTSRLMRYRCHHPTNE